MVEDPPTIARPDHNSVLRSRRNFAPNPAIVIIQRAIRGLPKVLAKRVFWTLARLVSSVESGRLSHCAVSIPPQINA